MADTVYKTFSEAAGDKALVCLGSNKSNPVVEALVAASFGSEPFISQDTIATATKRSCPIFLRYRDNDPQFPSCFGGTRLAKNQASNKPGIYYEKADGGWGCCEWADGKYGRRIRLLRPSRVAGADGNGPRRFLGTGHAACWLACSRDGATSSGPPSIPTKGCKSAPLWSNSLFLAGR